MGGLSDGVGSVGHEVARYVNGWQVPGIFYLGGRLLGVYANNQFYAEHVNALGSSQMNTDAAGTEDGDILFYPWGQVWTGQAPSWQFSAFDYEDNTAADLSPTLNRDYSSGLGRWLTPDPGGKNVVKLDDPQTWNMYAYVRNNPTTLTDPSGLCPNSADSCNGSASPVESDKHVCNQETGDCQGQKDGGDQERTQDNSETLNNVKTGLDLAAFIPVVGDFTNLASAGISAYQGNYGDAGLSVLAAIPVVGMVGEIGKGAEVVRDAETLTRFGKEVESAEKLATQAAAAEEKIGIHGVSTTARPNPRTPGSSALRSEVEEIFKVHNTGSDPFHRTVELAKPVTQAVADAFNRVFGRIP